MSDQAEEQSLEERMINVLDAENPELDEEVETEEVEEQELDEEDSTEESEEESEEEDSEEEQPSATVKLKVNGEELEKPLEEVISLAQQGIDYTQKTQKVAEERRQLEEYAQTVKVQEQKFQQYVQDEQALIKDLAQITAVEEQLAEYANVNWDAVSEQYSVENAQKLFFKYNQLQTKHGQLLNTVAQKRQQLAQDRQNKLGSTIEENVKILKQEIPSWDNELYGKLQKHIIENYGATPYEAANTVDARTWRLVHKAYLYDQLIANPTSKQKISEAKPIIKPGAKDSKQQATSQTKAIREQLRKTGDGNLAQKLIERML